MTENNSLPEREVIFRETYVYLGTENQRITETIEYPAPKEDIAQFVAKFGIGGDVRHIFFSESWASAIPGIYDRMPDSVNLDELNYLAKQIQALDGGQREVYAAAVEAGVHCGRMDELINLAANVVKFRLIPPDKQSNVEDGILTSKGILIVSGEFEEPYRWVGDIPHEQRATEHLDRYFVPEPTGIVKGIDLSVLTFQLHGICGDYMADAPDSLATLEAMRSAECLLLFDERGAFLTGAAHAYREGSPAYDRFMSAANTPDTKVFALHVTDVWTETEGEPERGSIIGDIVSVDLRDQQWDIKVNTVYPKLLNGERHFEHKDYHAVHRHVERVSSRHQETEIPEPLESAEFLSDLNRSFMANAKNPQDDKIRITQSAAKEMLARGDAKVYRLMEHGAILQSKLAAVHIGSNSLQKSVFAINPSDMAGLDAWAKRAASEMTRQAQERGEQKKSRGKEM